MLNAKLMATSDLEVALNTKAQAPDNVQILYVGDPISKPNIDAVNAVPFCPDYNVLALYVDGAIDRYRAAYLQYIESPIAGELFASILYALKTGTHVILYFPKETVELNYPEYLLSYICSVYGIVAQTNSTQFQYNEMFNSSNYRAMYIFNLITAAEFILNVEEVDDMVIMKLKNEWIGAYPEIDKYTPQQMLDFIERMKEHVRTYGTDAPTNVMTFTAPAFSFK